MKSAAILCAIAAASLGFAPLSFGQPNDNGRGRSGMQDSHQGRQAERVGKPSHDRRMDYGDARRNDRHDHYNARSPEFRRGGYIPREYRSHQYVVSTYRTYRLSPPPRGHQWVQVGSDFVLIAIATGLIANIVLNY
jgi:Ni/Co efflux regulator RcnB